MSGILECAKRNDVHRLRKLVEQGKSLEKLTFDGESVLHIGALRGSIDVIKYALTQKVDINAKTRYYQETAVQMAIQEGHDEVFNALVNAGADLNTTNCEMETPLFTAVRWERKSMIPVLISKGVDVNAKNLAGDTPLAVSLMFGNYSIVKELLDAKARTDLPCIDQQKLNSVQGNSEESFFSRMSAPSPMLGTPDLRTPREIGQHMYSGDILSFPGCVEDPEIEEAFLEICDGEPDALQGLINEGFNVNTQIFDDETPLHVACSLGRFEIAKKLVEAGCDVNARTLRFQEAPIEAAIESGEIGIVKLLVDANADLETENMEGETPIFVAVRSGNEAAVDLLLQKGVNVRKKNRGGVTPFGMAVMLREEGIAKKLLAANSDVTESSVNLFLVAQENGQKEIEAMIRKANASFAESSKPSFYYLRPPLSVPLRDNESMKLEVPEIKLVPVQPRRRANIKPAHSHRPSPVNTIPKMCFGSPSSYCSFL